ncbi:MAG TPA: hypothetical protein VEH27_10110 [Methylomirabilota bacterium]|nr:hypothetical protein [Methylomirabilota bacterium]
MEPAFRKHGKVAHGMTASGTVTREMVEQRAAENALINGRDKVNADDLRAARLELLGYEASEDSDDIMGNSLTNENPGSTGEPVVNIRPRDEQAEAEKMVKDGMEEAQHTTMVEGARYPKNQE